MKAMWLTGALVASLAAGAFADEKVEGTEYTPTEAARAATGLYSDFAARDDQNRPLSARSAEDAQRQVQRWMDAGIPTSLRGSHVQQVVTTSRYFDVTTDIRRARPSNRYWFWRARVWNRDYFEPAAPARTRPGEARPMGTLGRSYRTPAEVEVLAALLTAGDFQVVGTRVLKAFSARETADAVVAEAVFLGVSMGDFGIDRDTVTATRVTLSVNKRSGAVTLARQQLGESIEISHEDIGGN